LTGYAQEWIFSPGKKMGFNVRCGRNLLAVDRNSIKNCTLAGTVVDEIYLGWNNFWHLFQAHAVAIVQTSINKG
jgi:hypothetical protein